VPLTAVGNLSIVASADLGPLGPKAGIPVAYNWTLPSIAPVLLPWLAILGLLALKANRKAAAWLIWLPLACLIAFNCVGLPSGVDVLLDDVAALVLGLAAVWLLSPYLRKGHRLVTSLLVLLALGAFSELALFSKLSANSPGPEWIALAIVLGLGVLAIALALLVCGWLCRRRFSPIKLYVWSILSILIVWLAVVLPIFLVQNVAGLVPWSEFLIPVIVAVGINFGVLLPFLILSSANTFYRERLKSLLHVQPLAPPPTLNLPVPQAAAVKA
jgi:hypothetical protein